MKLSHLTVRARLLAGFGALVLVAVLLSVLAISSLGRSHDDFQKYVQSDAALLTLANDVLDAANARAVGARNLVLAPDAAARSAEVEGIKKAHQKVGDRLAELKSRLQQSGASGAKSLALVDEIDKIESRYGPIALDIVKLAVEDQKDQAITKMNNECRPLLAALLKATGAYIDHEAAEGVESVHAAQGAYEWSRGLLIGGCLLAVALAAALSIAITRSLTRALGAEPARLAEVAQQVAAGNLAPIAEANGVSEGSVLASLCHMQGSLADVVGKVRGASDSIATASGEIATGTTDLSQRTEEQASNLQQTAASMEQMNSTVKSNADTAQQATQLAASASSVAQRGGQVVDQVVATMSDITASSKKISEIIGVIDGIAFQTNILALNAAVEAARAGEQGRGFAVVAGEVRTLARRSADAAKEIKMLIGDSVEKVDAGGRLVNEAGATMTEIVQQVRKVTDLIGEIGAATIEQSKGVEQISHAVTQLDDVTQQNAALVEESAAAADSLKQQAAELARIVQTFTLGESDGRVVQRAAQRVAQPARPAQATAPKAALAVPGWSEF